MSNQLRYAPTDRGTADPRGRKHRLGDADRRLDWLSGLMAVAVFLIAPWPVLLVAVPVLAPLAVLWGAVWWARKDPAARGLLGDVRWWVVIRE